MNARCQTFDTSAEQKVHTAR